MQRQAAEPDDQGDDERRHRAGHELFEAAQRVAGLQPDHEAEKTEQQGDEQLERGPGLTVDQAER